MRKLLLITLLLLTSLSYSQVYSESTLRTALDSLATKHPGLNNNLQLNVSSLQLSDLLNSIALENNLNISVDPMLSDPISYNFFDAQVKDVMVFLYLNFDIEYDFVGSIMSVRKRSTNEKITDKPEIHKIDVSYNPANTFLSMNLRNDTLWRVTQEVTRISDKNIVIDPDVRDQKVNAYLLNRPIDQVLEMFAQSNNLILSEEDNYFRLSKNTDPDGQNANNLKIGNYKSQYRSGDFLLSKNPIGTIDILAKDIELADLVQAVAEETGVHYVFYSDIKGKTNLDLQDVRFDELVQRVFSGTPYSIREEDNVFFIGEKKMEGLRVTRMIRLENRTIESVLTAIPQEMMTGIDVKEFEELNGLIVTANEEKYRQLKEFVKSIDIVVPMVQIDVMLLFSEKGSATKTGIKAGIKDQPTVTQGTVFPELDVELGYKSVNNILNAITGFGLVNLGQVNENFYVSLQALESNNVIKIESTPKISTLNGHEASISIGETTYYQETQVNVQTSVTNQGVLQSQQWKSIEANLSVTIKPYVSTDEYVTLTISVEQDDFAGKVDPKSPPNISTQTFESVVRVKNGEMILLGGLEKKKKSDSGSGVPFLSRIPVIKWFFSSREKEREKSKLHILIRPIVSY